MKEKYIDVIEYQDAIIDYLADFIGADINVMQYAFSVQGINENTISDIIYYYSAYTDLWQLAECEDTQELYKDYGLELFEEDNEEEGE